MSYNFAKKYNLKPPSQLPQSDYDSFLKIVKSSVKKFTYNKVFEKLNTDNFKIQDYHNFLKMIFHQTYHGPSTFALAAGNCDHRFQEIRDYLILHAEEEKTHWQWVLADLTSTGYKGPDPRQEFAPIACQAYISFNIHIALKHPAARLGIAAVLETIGAEFGKIYAEKLFKILGITKDQAQFIFGHGNTDTEHIKDIFTIIEKSEFSPSEWAILGYAAEVGGELYRRMYDEAV